MELFLVLHCVVIQYRSRSRLIRVEDESCLVLYTDSKTSIKGAEMVQKLRTGTALSGFCKIILLMFLYHCVTVLLLYIIKNNEEDIRQVIMQRVMYCCTWHVLFPKYSLAFIPAHTYKITVTIKSISFYFVLFINCN
jgi:hypothetical protein